MRARSFALISLFCFLIIGCKPPSKFVGAWAQAPDPNIKSDGTVTLTFESNGKFEAKAAFPTGTIIQGGTYDINGNTVTFKCDRYDMSADDPATQMRVNNEKSQILAILKDPIKQNITWKTANQFEMPGFAGPLMLGGIFNRK